MVFSSLLFIFRFLPIALALYYLVPPKLKNLTLFLISLFFYSWGEVRYFPVMFLWGNNGFSRIAGTGSGKVLVIKDSYANSFVPFLLGDYGTIDVVDLRSLKSTTVDELIAQNGYDNVLVLYNFQSFSSDTNLVLLNRSAG